MSFSIQIRDMEGKPITIVDCKPTSTVAELKKAYSSYYKFGWERIRLGFGGEGLNDNQKLEEIKELKPNYILHSHIYSFAANKALHLYDNIYPRNTSDIQCVDNSCYLDASLISLFSFRGPFNECFKISTKGTGSRVEYEDLIKGLHEIVERIYYMFPYDGHRWALEGREKMAKVDSSYSLDPKDPAEFISAIFGKFLSSPPFYRIAGDATATLGGHVFQTYGIPEGCTLEKTSVQQLVLHSFKDSGIQLSRLPSPGFIIKLPVSNGKHVFSKVFPNLKLSLDAILPREFVSIEDQSGYRIMGLKSVMCLEGGHFTTFIRSDSKDILSPWFYFGANQQCEHLPYLSFWLAEEKHLCECKMKEEPLLQVLLTKGYICMYLPIAEN